MINFPSKLRIGIPVVTKFHWFATHVVPPFAGIIVLNSAPFLPDSSNRGLSKRFAGNISIAISCHFFLLRWFILPQSQYRAILEFMSAEFWTQTEWEVGSAW